MLTSPTDRKASRSSTWKIRSGRGSTRCSTPAARSTTRARCRSEASTPRSSRLVADGKKRIARHPTDLARHRPRRDGLQSTTESGLIATFPMHGEAVAVSRGLERDRVVDETGGQTVVFGRRGARPFHLSEMSPFFRHIEGGDLYRVEDVTTRDGKLFTRGGRELQPNPTPTPTASPVPASP